MQATMLEDALEGKDAREDALESKEARGEARESASLCSSRARSGRALSSTMRCLFLNELKQRSERRCKRDAGDAQERPHPQRAPHPKSLRDLFS